MKYLAIIITTTAISALFLTSLAYAQVPATVKIYAWTDKTYYNPGEKGVLHMVIRNDREDEDIILKNITITYPWFAYTGEKWEGNDTITPDVAIMKNGGIYTKTVEFNIPMDGRAVGGMYGLTPQIKIKVNVDKPPYHYPTTGYHGVPIYVKSTPLYISFEDMDKIVTLFTVQAVLTIVCTIIIAATIFLSARRPRITWRKEEAAEAAATV